MAKRGSNRSAQHKAQHRTVITPRVLDLADGGGSVVSDDSKLSFWKQILPETSINYVDDETGEARTLDFNREYFTDLTNAFDEKAIDSTGFLLAGKDNEHTMDPERFRAQVDRLATEDELPESVQAELTARHGSVPKGLYSKLTFASKKAAKAVRLNPNLGVSARIREGMERSDGKKFNRAIIHVLGTLDPKVPGMSAWTPAVNLSEYAADNVIDLSSRTYPEVSVSKKTTKTGVKPGDVTVPKIEDVDPEDIKDWSDETLAAFLEANAELIDEPDDDASDDDSDDDDEINDDDEIDDELDTPDTDPAKGRQLQGASLSTKAQHEINLANSAARDSQRTARDALNRVATAEWNAEKERLLNSGVPPHIIELSEPALRGHSDAVVDLSNAGGKKNVNFTQIVRKLVEGYEGTIDLSEVERGHGGGTGGDDPDAEVRKAFDEMTSDL